ncbi:MAG: serine-type D-Ala-D-Ala carboxypeptidase, partial [Clostridia bacterium]|nr:serine-type D-Ala-D-Ala carboxypeptidase [Clostridia bacterium]
IDWYENITAPVVAGDKVGTLKITHNGETLAEIDLNAASEVKKKGIGDIIRDLLLSVFFGI